MSWYDAEFYLLSVDRDVNACYFMFSAMNSVWDSGNLFLVL